MHREFINNNCLIKKGIVLFPLQPKGWSFHKTSYMKREEEILNKAIDYSEIEENFLEYDDCGDVCDDKTFIEKAFIKGAEWADKTMLDRACEWLRNRHNIEKCLNVLTSRTEDLSKAFRQAMEGK